MKIRPVRAEAFHTDTQTDTTKLIVAFRNLANTPNKMRTMHKCLTARNDELLLVCTHIFYITTTNTQGLCHGSRRLVAGLKALAGPYGIYGAPSGTGTDFSPSTLVSPVSIIPPILNDHSFIHSSITNAIPSHQVTA